MNKMNQTFENLRAILHKHKENMPVIAVAELLAEIDESEATWNEHGDCKKCKYEFTSVTSKPCKNCMWLQLDHFEPKDT